MHDLAVEELDRSERQLTGLGREQRLVKDLVGDVIELAVDDSASLSHPEQAGELVTDRRRTGSLRPWPGRGSRPGMAAVVRLARHRRAVQEHLRHRHPPQLRAVPVRGRHSPTRSACRLGP